MEKCKKRIQFHNQEILARYDVHAKKSSEMVKLANEFLKEKRVFKTYER